MVLATKLWLLSGSLRCFFDLSLPSDQISGSGCETNASAFLLALRFRLSGLLLRQVRPMGVGQYQTVLLGIFGLAILSVGRSPKEMPSAGAYPGFPGTFFLRIYQSRRGYSGRPGWL